jgi:chromosome segregation ATPase
MRIPSQMSDSAFQIMHSAKHTKAGASSDKQSNPLASEMAEVNKRLDNMIRNQNPSPEQLKKLEEIRKQFNDRLTKVGSETSDRMKLMTEYRSARSELSDQLSSLFGGPRAG